MTATSSPALGPLLNSKRLEASLAGLSLTGPSDSASACQWLAGAEPPPADPPSRDSRWNRIGSGGYGTVWRCQQEPVVWKTWKKSAGPGAAYLVAQSLLLRGVAEWPPSLCPIDSGLVICQPEPGEDARVWLAMPYVGQRASDAICPADEPRLRRELLAAVDFLAGRGLAHNDIYPRNIMRAGPGAPFVLIDFDFVALLDEPGCSARAPLSGFRAHPCAAALRAKYSALGTEPGAAALATSLWQVGLACIWCLAGGQELGAGLEAILDECAPLHPQPLLDHAGLPLTAAQVGGAAPLTGGMAKLCPGPELRELLSDDPAAHRAPYPPRDYDGARRWWEGCNPRHPHRKAWVMFAEAFDDINCVAPLSTALLKIVFIAMADRMGGAGVDLEALGKEPASLLANVLADFVADIYSPLGAMRSPVPPQPAHWRAIQQVGLPPLGAIFAGHRGAEHEALGLAALDLQKTAAGAAVLYAALAQTGRPPASLYPTGAGS